MTNKNFSGDFYLIILSFSFMSIFSALNNWVSLILRASNRYLYSYFLVIFGNLGAKIIGISLYLEYGFEYFVLSIVAMPVIIFILGLLTVRNHVKWGYVPFRHLLRNISYFDFAALGFLKYSKNQADRLLITLLVTPELQSSYSIAKQLQDVGKVMIEGFFDPLVQKIVTLKGDVNSCLEAIASIHKIHFVMLMLAISFGVFLFINIEYYVGTFNLDKYPFLDVYVFLAYLCTVVYLASKIVGNLFNLFAPARNIIIVELSVFLISLLSLIYVTQTLDASFLYLSRVFVEITLAIIFTISWRNNRSKFLLGMGL